MNTFSTPAHPLTVTAENHLERLDYYLSKSFSDYSRSFFKRLIEDGHVSINGKPVSKQGTPVKKDDIVSVTFPTHSPREATALLTNMPPIEIVFEHKHFLIINKPANLLVHQAATKAEDPSVVDWLLTTMHDIAQIGQTDRPGIVHRLDKDTSGLLVIARTNYAHGKFADLFKDRTIKKTYRAIVHGHPPRSGIIDLSIGRHPVARHKMAAFPANSPTRQLKREAVTHYQVLNYFEDCALVEAKPVTGRTHQIRVHLAAIGHPIVGDTVYGTQKTIKIKRQALHAYGLTFIFDEQEFNFTQQEPVDFAALLKQPEIESMQ